MTSVVGYIVFFAVLTGLAYALAAYMTRVYAGERTPLSSLLIPVEAAGAERLFDAFAALPGMDTAALVAAVRSERPGTGTALALDTEVRQVWRRSERGVVVR